MLKIVSSESDHENGIGGGDAETHDCAHHGGHTQRSAGEIKSPNHTGQRAGQRGQNNERVEPALEIDNKEQINKGDGHDESNAQPQET